MSFEFTLASPDCGAAVETARENFSANVSKRKLTERSREYGNETENNCLHLDAIWF